MKIPQQTIDLILSRVSLSSIVEAQGIELINAGAEVMAKCPFHNDNTASMSINDEKGVYHCFACDASGNTIQFLQEIKHIDFLEALEELAKLAGIDLKNAPKDQNYIPRPKNKNYHYLEKLKNNLSKFNDYSFCWGSRSKDDTKDVWNLFYPGINKNTGKAKTGSPAEGLSPSKINYFKRQSKNRKRKISCAVSLFGNELITKHWEDNNGKSHTTYRQKRSKTNATHCLMVSLDFDNYEWKSQKTKPEFKNIDNRNKFLLESKKRLFQNIFKKLDKLLLWDYATVIDSGTGYHVHFILDSIADYTTLDTRVIPELFEVGEYYDFVIKNLILNTKADPAPSTRASIFKLIPGMQYWKVEPSVEITVKKDSKQFLKFGDIFQRLRDNGEIIKGADLKKRFSIYRHTEKLFETLGREPENDFLCAIDKFYERLPSKVDIEGDFADYIENGILPGGDEAEAYYNGKETWENNDGSAIKINKSYRMQYREIRKKKDKEGNTEWVENWVSIPSGWALVPKYKIEEDDSLDFKVVFDCLRKNERRTIVIEGEKFGTTDTLQRALRRQQVDINIAGQASAAIFSYAMTHVQKIKTCASCTNFDRKGNSFLVGYDYIYQNGQIFRGDKSGIIKTDDDIYFINHIELKKVNQHKSDSIYVKNKPNFTGKFTELGGKIDSIFQSKQVSKLYLSFLAMSLIRKPLLDLTSQVPFLSLHGDTGCGKSTLLEVAQNIFNLSVNSSKPTVSTIFKIQKAHQNSLILFDELDDHHLMYIMPFLKDAVTNAYRRRQDKNGQIITDDQILNTPIIATNMPIHYEGEAWDNRMLKIRFSKNMRKENVDGLSDLMYFVAEQGHNIYLDMFEKVKKIDFQVLKSEIHQWEKSIVEPIGKDLRLAQMYAIVISVGRQIGILTEKDTADLLEFIIFNESDKGSAKALLEGTLVECATFLTQNNPPVDGIPHEIKQKNPDPTIFAQEYPIKLSRFTNFVKFNNVFQNIDQNKVNRMLYAMPYVTKLKTQVTHFIRGVIEKDNGVIIKVNFGDEVFKDMLLQNIPCGTKKKTAHVIVKSGDDMTKNHYINDDWIKTQELSGQNTHSSP